MWDVLKVAVMDDSMVVLTDVSKVEYWAAGKENLSVAR